MKSLKQISGALVAGAALVLGGCSGIGDGSTVESMKIVFTPEARDQSVVVDRGLATEHLRAFDCFCSNLSVVGTFSDGTLANFNSRAHWASDNESVLKVANYQDVLASSDAFFNCPIAQRAPGLLMPVSPGTAVVTASFLGFNASYTIEVVDTAAAAGGTLKLAPVDTSNAGEVAVGALLPLGLTATLDGRPRDLRLNAAFAIDPANATVGIIDSIGRVSGLSPDQGAPLNAKATFGTCTATATASIRVGEVVSPLTISEEPGLSSDAKLAKNTNELVKVIATLDFGDGGSTGSMDVSSQSFVEYTDHCTVRTYDASVPTTSCAETATPDCPGTLPVCSTASATACTAGMEACRTVAAPMSATFNRITAVTPYDTPTTFSARFPALSPAVTKIPSGLSVSATSLTVSALVGYPAVAPWEAVIDKGVPGKEEIVQVTARDLEASPLVMTVVRGHAGTTPVAHDANATFELRHHYTDNTVDLQAVAGTLTELVLDAPPTTLQLYESKQIDANGTFTDPDTMATRIQHIAHLTTFAAGSPAAVWGSSKPGIASVSSGLVRSLSPCGGTTVIRLRGRSSSDAAQADDKFVAAESDPGTGDDLDGNGLADANDSACGTDLLCDQVAITIPRADPLPPGFTTESCDAL